MELTAALQSQKHPTYDAPSHQTSSATRKITVNDWNLHNTHLSTMAQTLRNEDLSACEVSHKMADNVRLSTLRKQQNVTDNLSQRLSHIERAQDNLQVASDLVDKEILALERVKSDTEKMLLDMSRPLEVAKLCLENREQRRATDAVRDKPEDELLKEVRLIERIKSNLQIKIQQCFEQLNRLRQVRSKIIEDSEDKSRAHYIDSTCQKLTEVGKVSYQFQPNQQRGLGSNPTSWAKFSDHNCQRAAVERDNSRSLREKTVTCQNASRCDLVAQNNSVDQSLRIRINEMEEAKNQLDFNKNETLLEINHAEQEISNLKQAIKDQIKPMQIAQTRMFNREQRPNVELCHDFVESGIKGQLHMLNVDNQHLEFQLEKIHECRQELRQTLCRIEDDLNSKIYSLEIDQKCLQLRS